MKVRAILGALVATLVLAPADARAAVKLPKIFGSHMVLQRDMPVNVWGWAAPDEAVTVKLGDNEAKATADKDGDWKVSLPALKADGKGHTLTVEGSNRIELTDVLVGEVWVGSGQSNMEWPLVACRNSKEAIAAAQHAQVRLFHVPKVQVNAPAKDVNAAWKTCSPETVPQFSAVLYYFGLKLHKELGVPVGLINSSWGGSPIEPWTVTDKGSGGMHNGMIAPLQPFAIRGVIWYQGETNAFQKNGLAYTDKMKDLIAGWRKVWGEGMPFYFVHLAPFKGYPPGELEGVWEAQTASLKVSHTGMAVITDLVHKIDDIHPIDKKEVGDRLALWALTKDYGKKDLVYSGPLYKSMTADGGKIRLRFAHAEGLKSRDGKPLGEFEVAGADGKFAPAEAVVEGDEVVVSAKDVASPTQVRFGWRSIANPNLVNKAGLPAAPFHTDNWQGGTGE